MWLLLVEMFIALFIIVFIIWWTLKDADTIHTIHKQSTLNSEKNEPETIHPLNFNTDSKTHSKPK